MRLDGIVVPLITPLKPDESLDEAGLERLVEHVITGGVSGIFVLGSSGEGPALTQATRERLVRAVSEQAKGRVPLLVGALAVGTRATIDLAQRLARHGGDAIVLVAPYYFAQAQQEIATHIATVAGALDVPVIVYNIPQMVKTVIEPETVATLAALPQVAAIKDSSGDMTRFQRLLTIRDQKQGFAVFQGAEGVAGISIALGADGAVLGLANLAPQLCRELYDAARSGDLGRTRALQDRLMLLWNLHTHGRWLPCLKMAVSQLGICGPTTTAPFSALPQDAVAAIRRDMEVAGVLPA